MQVTVITELCVFCSSVMLFACNLMKVNNTVALRSEAALLTSVQLYHASDVCRDLKNRRSCSSTVKELWTTDTERIHNVCLEIKADGFTFRFL